MESFRRLLFSSEASCRNKDEIIKKGLTLVENCVKQKGVVSGSQFFKATLLCVGSW